MLIQAGSLHVGMSTLVELEVGLMCRPQGINVVGIGMDGEGMRPDSLDERLSSWNEKKEGRKPRVAYIVPYLPCPFIQAHSCRTGQNPSGATMFLQRRKALYSIFQKHDILIIEDEPYCTSPSSKLSEILHLIHRFSPNGTIHRIR